MVEDDGRRTVMDNAEIESATVRDSEREFLHAVSLIAAMEGATELDGHAALLPYLGMARAELVDFGQRRVTGYLAIAVADLRAAVAELEVRLTAFLGTTNIAQHRLRVEAALRLLRRGIAATGRRPDVG